VTDAEQPEDERTPEDEAPAEEPAAEAAAEAPAEPVAEEPVAEEEAPAAEPIAEEEPAEEPVAEEPPAGEEAPAAEPIAEEEPAETPPAEEPSADEEAPAAEPVAKEPAATEEAPAEPVPAEAPAAEPPAAAAEPEEEIVEEAPRVKPEIPGADLVPDIVPEGADALALEELEMDQNGAPVAEAEAEDEQAPQPITGAEISLASGARYTATGKRKTAVARVILKPGTGEYTVNGKPLEQFFPRPTLQRTIRQPLETVAYEARMDVVAKLHGGGVSAQAGALRHGIARALLEADPNLRGELKRRGFLTRDARAKERKKAGLKKARKRPQFSKR
jgi:small subunit ribosomal protein S9